MGETLTIITRLKQYQCIACGIKQKLLWSFFSLHGISSTCLKNTSCVWFTCLLWQATTWLPDIISADFAFLQKYRAVLSKCEIFIKMRVAESRPSFDIEKSLFNKNTLFFNKNHFLFYHLKLEMSIFTNFCSCTDFLINLRDLRAKQRCRGREECFELSIFSF